MGNILRFRTRVPAGWQHRPTRQVTDRNYRRRPRWRKGSIRLRDTIGILVLMVAVAVAGIQALGGGRMLETAPQFVAIFTEPDSESAAPTRSSVLDLGRMVSRHFPLCSGAERRNCVVDGDTLWIDGEKIRVADINAPESSSPQCRDEAILAAQASERLRQLGSGLIDPEDEGYSEGDG